MRGLLLVHTKYFSTSELLERVVADTRKYAFLLRVVCVWVRDMFDTCLCHQERCVEILSRLLADLEGGEVEGGGALTKLHVKTRALLKEVGVKQGVSLR